MIGARLLRVCLRRRLSPGGELCSTILIYSILLSAWHKRATSRISEVMNILDLHDICLLMNYERATTEPLFRHAKLREVVSGGADFKSVHLALPLWTQAKVPKTGFVFDKPKGRLSKREKLEPDLVSNMLPVPIPPQLQSLSSKDLELCYWQALNHDGCYRNVIIFQNFLTLFPLDA